MNEQRPDDAGPPVTTEELSSPAEERAGGDEPLGDATPQETGDAAREFLEGLLDAMGLEAAIAIETEPDRALVDVTGDDLGLLIGRRGQTLDALQELVRAAVQRRLRARARLLVDVEGYRARRRASLAEYARAMAQRAKERGTEIELEPMNSYERKIVHDAVADIDGATSFSEGDEPDRKVIVRGE
ncbi:MAG: KH domain-containing protein [Actinomycetota bacterium]|nr:KH domain-containing protein [Actinomycetota bacterium]